MKCFIKGNYPFSLNTASQLIWIFFLLKIVKKIFTQITQLFRWSISEKKLLCLKVWISSRCQVPAMKTTWKLLPCCCYTHPVPKIRTAAPPCRLPSITTAFSGEKKRLSRCKSAEVQIKSNRKGKRIQRKTAINICLKNLCCRYLKLL